VIGHIGRKPIKGIPDYDFILRDPVNVADSVEAIGIVARVFTIGILA
jgi:hypothetical protein